MSSRRIFYIRWKPAVTIFSQVITKKRLKWSNLRKSVKNSKILTEGGQRGIILKLFVLPSLLKHENTFLIAPTKGSLQARGRNTRVFHKIEVKHSHRLLQNGIPLYRNRVKNKKNNSI